MEERGWAYRRRQPEGTVLYEAVRENLATLLAEASDVGRGVPRYVERDFARYLECGVLAHGFARVRCESCKDELLVAFSCKGRGVCPSCNAKRAHVTAVHRVERVLPHVPYRQWTLSFPHRVRWVLLKDVGLLSDVLTVFLRAVFALQRRRARTQGIRRGQVGAVSFIPFFGSALQVAPHEAPAAGRHDASALHRAYAAPPAGQPGASSEGKPDEVPRRLCSRRATAAISGPPSRCGGGERDAPRWPTPWAGSEAYAAAAASA